MNDSARRLDVATPAQRRALWLAVGLLLALAGGLGGLVQHGLRTGETRLPAKRLSLARPVARSTEPALFWVSVSLYAAVGGGALWLGLRGARAATRLVMTPHTPPGR